MLGSPSAAMALLSEGHLRYGCGDGLEGVLYEFWAITRASKT